MLSLTSFLDIMFLNSLEDVLTFSIPTLESPKKISTTKEMAAIKVELDGMIKSILNNREDLGTDYDI